MFEPVHAAAGQDYLVVDAPLAGEDHLSFCAPPNQESVVKPDYYNMSKVSPYDVGEAMYGKTGLLTYVLINSIKYIQRYPKKYQGQADKQLEDLMKARQSLDKAIELHKELNCNVAIRHG